MQIDILTLFPEIYPGPLGDSIIGRAVKNGILKINAINLRDFSHDERGTVDDKPYGGGPGMLMKIEPLAEAVRHLRKPDTEVILMGPRGKRFTQEIARELSEKKHLLIVCGHYEGVDERVRDLLIDREISIGDYILTSGNLAAMVVVDTVGRLLPGVLGCAESSEEESFSDGLLEYPQYTRPEEFEGLRAPEVLLSGDHAAIARYRQRTAEELTRKLRPDLWPTALGKKLQAVKSWRQKRKKK